MPRISWRTWENSFNFRNTRPPLFFFFFPFFLGFCAERIVRDRSKGFGILRDVDSTRFKLLVIFTSKFQYRARLILHYFFSVLVSKLYPRDFSRALVQSILRCSNDCHSVAVIGDKKRIYFTSGYRSNFDRANNFPANGITRVAVCDFPRLKAGTSWLPFCTYVCACMCDTLPCTSTCISNLLM